MLSQFFILSLRGDPIISRDYRHDVTRDSAEIFFRHLKLPKDGKAAPAVFNVDGVNYMHTTGSRARRLQIWPHLICTHTFSLKSLKECSAAARVVLVGAVCGPPNVASAGALLAPPSPAPVHSPHPLALQLLEPNCAAPGTASWWRRAPGFRV
jgi:hypothetical protein